MLRSFGKTKLRLGVATGALFLAASVASACGQVLGLDGIDYDVPEGGAGPDGGPTVTPGPDATTTTDAPVGTAEGSALDSPIGDSSSPPNDDAASAPDALTTIATSPNGAGAVQGLAIDARRLYWVTAGSNGYVLSALKDGGAMTTIASGQPYPLDIAVLGTTVYWSVVPAGAGPRCMAMAAPTPGNVPDGGDAGATCVTTSADSTVRMTLGGGGVVLLAQGTGAAANNQYIGFATVGSTYTNAQTEGPAAAVTATTQQGFLGNNNGFHVDEVAFPGLTYGSIVCLSNCGGTVIEDMMTDVAVQNVLWVTQGGGVHTTSIHVNGAVGTQFVVLPGTPQRMARDATYIYVTTSGQEVYAVPLGQGGDGGIALSLSGEENAPFGIAVDSSWVYWGNADGTIRRTSVPGP